MPGETEVQVAGARGATLLILSRRGWLRPKLKR